MSSDFTGRVALVTGSSRNLGSTIAAALAEQGAQVAVHFTKHADQAQGLTQQIVARGGIATAFQADLAASTDVRRLAAEVTHRFGRVDILVNNVGPYADYPFLELPERIWDSVMDSSLKASYLLTQALAPDMKEHGWGRIVNITAASAFIRVHSVYGLAKAALIHLTESLALELAPEIRVNAVSPGQIQESDEIDQIAPGSLARMTAATPLKRLVTRQEVARAVCLLCSDQLPSVTGQTLSLDGGWTIPSGRDTPILNLDV
jgi:NAD(P)-dependent dehydrogenase (short-subunit alcohol dehydrogenase family)